MAMAMAIDRATRMSVWTRLLVMVPAFFAVTVVIGLTTGAVAGSAIASLAVGLALAAGAVWLYRRAVWWTERRPADELARTGAGCALGRGTVLGAGLFTLVIALTALFGGYEVVGWGSVGGLLATVGMMSAVAVGEELLFRGVVFRLLEERAGTGIAMAASAALFGLVHLVNPGASFWGALAVAVEAGLMLAAAYVATRTLWLPIGLHFAWNVVQGGVFGTTVSGSGGTPAGLLQGASTGPTVIGGGAFGPEAGLAAMVVGLITTGLFLRRAVREGRIRSRRG